VRLAGARKWNHYKSLDARLAKIKAPLKAVRWVQHGPAGKIKEALTAGRARL